MTPAKGQSSSHCKGKEIASNDPAMRDVGKEAAYSELERCNEEEAWRIPDCECTSLIDPWCYTHVHFLKVPSEYTPSLLGCVWLALCRRNTDISWALLASLILDLTIRQGLALPVSILFEFGLGTTLGWKEWVDTELFDKGFMEALQQASVLKAIVSSCCVSNYRDLFSLRHLVC